MIENTKTDAPVVGFPIFPGVRRRHGELPHDVCAAVVVTGRPGVGRAYASVLSGGRITQRREVDNYGAL